MQNIKMKKLVHWRWNKESMIDLRNANNYWSKQFINYKAITVNK
mgnify:CR=1 FL=1